ncbi:MAG: cytochrome P450 [Pseudomonadota bacterium]
MTDDPVRLTRFMLINPDYREKPDALLKDLREESPISRDEKARTFLLTRFRDIRAVLRNHSLWRSPDKAEPSPAMQRLIDDTFVTDPQTGKLRSMSIVQMDNPDHERVRKPLAEALYARVAKARPLIETVVDETLDALEGREGFDVLTDFAIPIPIDAIGAVLGVDRARRDEFREWSEGAVLYLKPARTPEENAYREGAMASLHDYFNELMAARRANPQDDLITDMVTLQSEGAEITDDELRTNLLTLLTAGNLTTSDLIGNGVHLLLTHPEELAKLKADPELIGQAVEEILRYEPPNEAAFRIASQDMEVAGCPVAKTQSMTCLLRAANRDPEQFEDPDRFNITRARKPHITFGGGVHLCLGAPLARAEAQIAYPKLFERFPNLRLANPQEAPKKRVLPFLNGFETLQVLV